MDTNLPFYSNTPDNTHCFQAAIKMLAKHYWPQEEYSWEELDKLSAKAKDLWTWPMAGVLWLQNKGLAVIDIETFDYSRFINEKEKYLLSFFGEEAGKEQIIHSNIHQELDFAREFQNKIDIQNRIPNKNDLIRLLEEGYLLICCINQMALNEESGYSGHFVIIKGYEGNDLFLHDPGLPAYENRRVSFELFEKAWAYPNEHVKNVLAFKSKK